ncbi:MAG: hypothetical protein VW874_04885 [Gammaproteobacteria bacterium]
MGGNGSGNWCRSNRKITTEEVRRLDIRLLKRNGWLIPGTCRELTWSTDNKPSGSIHFKASDDKLILNYKVRTTNSEWEAVKETVYLEDTACNFGGVRKWIMCPTCSKRVLIIYGAGKRFLCRHCHNLSYSSQNENSLWRMFRRARKIRKLLGAESDIEFPISDKPKGMHWRTFNKLVQEESEASSYVLDTVARYL